jgi:uncharacterized protein YjeT (DUF2065 family)
MMMSALSLVLALEGLFKTVAFFVFPTAKLLASFRSRSA